MLGRLSMLYLSKAQPDDGPVRTVALLHPWRGSAILRLSSIQPTSKAKPLAHLSSQRRIADGPSLHIALQEWDLFAQRNADFSHPFSGWAAHGWHPSNTCVAKPIRQL